MHCSKSSDFLARLLRMAAAMLLLVLAGQASSTHAEARIEIKSVRIKPMEGTYEFDADFQITLNHKLEHALEKGIVLYFVTELGLVNSRWYWFDERVGYSRVREGLSYYALTRQYRLTRGALSQSFGSLNEALQALSRVRDRPINASEELIPHAEYTVELRMRLDIAALPKPFQVETLGSREWDLGSGTLRWNTRLPPQKLQDSSK